MGVNSRVGMRAMGLKAPYSVVLQARQVDDLELLLWSFSKGKEQDRPKMIANSLIEDNEPKEVVSFKTGEDFLKEREKIIKGIT